jgi:putative tributyrin esterase
MALVHCDFFSETLGLCMSMYVILPQRTQGQIGMKGQAGAGKHPTLYLLHGLSDDHTIWLRRTSIERYVAPLGLAVVMPAVHRSYYTDMQEGGRYWTYISEELPRRAREFFPLSDRRADNFVAGLSMGGYGAFKLALNCPARFCAAASLSGALRLNAKDLFGPQAGDRLPEMRRVFGSPQRYARSANDLEHVARRLARSGKPRPRLFQCCGTEDFLYAQNVQFRAFIERLGYDLTYEEETGAHEWGYWDRKIQRVLEWLPLRPTR